MRPQNSTLDHYNLKVSNLPWQDQINHLDTLKLSPTSLYGRRVIDVILGLIKHHLWMSFLTLLCLAHQHYVLYCPSPHLHLSHCFSFASGKPRVITPFTFSLFTACSKILGNTVYRSDRTPKESSAQQDRIQIHSNIQYAMTSICKHNLQALIGSRAHVCVVVGVVVVHVVAWAKGTVQYLLSHVCCWWWDNNILN